MDGLKKFKGWYLIDEAAQHLTTLIGGNVSVADLLRLALDQHLQLSVRIVTPTKARPGFRFHTEEESIVFAALIEADPGSEVEAMNIRGGESIFLAAPNDGVVESEFAFEEDTCENGIGLIVENYVVPLSGVFNLTMFSDGRHIVEGHYLELIGEPATARSFDKGIYVEGEDRKIYQLQEAFNETVFMSRQQAQSDRLQEYIDDNNLSELEAEEINDRQERRREAYLRFRDNAAAMRMYMPAGSLPSNAMLVVRAESLAAFEASSNPTSSSPRGAKVPVKAKFHASLGIELPTTIVPEPDRRVVGDRDEPGPKNWKIRIQAEATRMFREGRKHGAQPSVYSIMDDLARWCRDNNVRTPTGGFPAAGYIRSHVLSGKHWKPPEWDV